MSNISVSLETLTTALKDAAQSALPWVTLKPEAALADELTRPTLASEAPAVTASFVLVPDLAYQFVYTNCQYVRLSYVLERNSQYEAGTLHLMHDGSGTTATLGAATEGSQPQLSQAGFVSPQFFITRDVSLQTAGSLGVSFSLANVTAREGESPRFGLSFKITDSLPSVFPRLTASVTAALRPPS